MSPLRPGTRPTELDRPIIATCYSLGLASPATLYALHFPDRTFSALYQRLYRLRHAGYLDQLNRPGARGLHAVGRASLPPGTPRPWRPSLAQLDHTLAVGDTLAALAAPGRLPELRITGWKGEAELREWAEAGQPFPDLQISWAAGQRSGTWQVEVDRGTESQGQWRRKLSRYLSRWPDAQLLAVTPGAVRARNLAQLGADMGMHLQAMPAGALADPATARVYDSRQRRLVPLSSGWTEPAGSG